MNGWTNHVTWQYWTLMNNNEALYTAAMAMTRDAKSVEDLAKTFLDLGGDERINWKEIAEALWESK